MVKGRSILRACAYLSVACCSVLTQSSALEDDPFGDTPLEEAGPDTHFLDAVWVGGTFGTGRYVDSTGQFEAHDPAVGDVHAVSLDESRGRVWVFAKGRLQIRDFTGALLREVAVHEPPQPTDALVSPDEMIRDGTLEDALCVSESLNINDLPYDALWPLAQLATNNADGATWLAIGNRLYKYDLDGELTGSQTAPKLITGLAADPKRSRWWVSSCQAVTLYDRAGIQLFRRGFTQLLDYVKDIHFDRLSDRLWVAQREFILSFGPDGELLLTRSYGNAVLANAEFIAGDGADGAWVAAGGLLRHINGAGTTDTSMSLFDGLLPLSALGLPLTPHADAVDLSSNLRNLNNWVANRQTLLHISGTGQVLKTIPLQNLVPNTGTQPIALPLPALQPVIGAQGRIRSIALYTDLFPPELEILCPGEGEYLWNQFDHSDPPRAQPFRVVVSYQERGIGLDPNSLVFTLNGTDTSASCERVSGPVDCAIEEPPVLLAIAQPEAAQAASSRLASSDVEPLKEGRYLCEISRAEEGPVELAVTARDYVGNRSVPVARRFVLDNHPPKIVIESPLHGSILNSHDITLTGHISEPVTLEINDEPAVLDPNHRFSHPVTLAEGDNYVYVYAVDRAGRASGRNAHYFVDTIAPQRPDDSKTRIIYRDGVAEILGEAGSVERNSLITITNLRTGESVSVQADFFNGSFSASIAAELGDQLRIVSSDRAGNHSEVYEDEVQQPLYIQLHFLAPGEQVERGYLLVRGSITALPGAGVTVNGESAAVLGNDLNANFYAMVEIRADTTEIVAQIADRSGRSRSVMVPITTRSGDPFQLRAHPFSGVAPALIGFEVEDDLGREAGEIKMDFDGDGSFDLMTTDPDEPLEFTYATPGLYEPRTEVTTTDGRRLQASTSVIIADPAREDAVIQQLWTELKDALLLGDKERALGYFSPDTQTQDQYGAILDVLVPEMNEILADFTPIVAADINAGNASYIVMTVNSEQQGTFVLSFLRDRDGLWRLYSM